MFIFAHKLVAVFYTDLSDSLDSGFIVNEYFSHAHFTYCGLVCYGPSFTFVRSTTLSINCRFSTHMIVVYVCRYVFCLIMICSIAPLGRESPPSNGISLQSVVE